MGKIGIIGNFSTNEIGGQTLRTAELKRAIDRRYGECNTLDAYKIWKKPWRCFSEISSFLDTNENVAVVLSERGFFLTLPFLIWTNKKYKRKIIEFVVGGCRQEWLKKHFVLRHLDKKIDLIYVQSTFMAQKYKQMGLNQVYYQPNFRQIKALSEIPKRSLESAKVKFCFLSRIVKEKGIHLAADYLTEINELYSEKYTLDVYGPVAESYKAEFYNLLSEYDCLNYCGIVQQADIGITMEKYDILMFPSYHIGEGFPGVFLDAMSAGVVILCNDCENFSDSVIDGMNGYKISIKDSNRWVDAIRDLIENPEKLCDMKKNSLNSVHQYHTENVLKGFFEYCEMKDW